MPEPGTRRIVAKTLLNVASSKHVYAPKSSCFYRSAVDFHISLYSFDMLLEQGPFSLKSFWQHFPSAVTRFRLL